MPKNLTAYQEAVRSRKNSKLPSEAKIQAKSVSPKSVAGKQEMPKRTNSNRTS